MEICHLVQAQFKAHMSVWLSQRRLVFIVFCKIRNWSFSKEETFISKEGGSLIWMVSWWCHLWFVKTKKKLRKHYWLVVTIKKYFICAYNLFRSSQKTKSLLLKHSFQGYMMTTPLLCPVFLSLDRSAYYEMMYWL